MSRLDGASDPRRHSYGILLAILVCQLMVVIDGTVVNIALPHIQAALHVRAADLSWVLNAYVLTFGGFLLLGARAGDLWGRRRVFIAGVVLFTVSSFVAGVSNTPELLFGARAAQGLGGALASPSALALLTVTFAEGRERMRALAYYTGVSIGGSAVGLVLGGLLVAWTSWRWIFFINLPIGVGLVVMARSVLPETESRPGKLDLAGALTSTVGMSAIVFALVRSNTKGWTDSLTIASMLAGVTLLVGFVLSERRAITPITPLHLFLDRDRATSYVVRFLLVGGSFSMFFFLSQFLQEVLGYDAIHTGLAFVPITVCLFGVSQLSAHVLSGLVPGRVQILAGLTMSATGLLLLSRISVHTTYGSLIVALVLFGSGNGLAFVPLSSMALAGVKHEDAGAASGLLNAAQQVGGALGLAVLVTVFGAASRNRAHHLPHAVTPHLRVSLPFVAGARWAFLLGSGLILASLGTVLASTRIGRPNVILNADELARAEAAGAGPV